ncbi:MAG: cytochrome c [Alphaproteobacteria bacterium]|nr:cytochrome c [Alphaproteobacteria bacterium]
MKVNRLELKGTLGIVVFTVVSITQPQLAFATKETPAERGAYIAATAGCSSCHTDVKNKGAELAGGVALKTPFGTFNVPNITPDRETGIGGWSDQDFIKAMTKGLSPKNEHYYPAFPYTSYTKMTRNDLLDLKAYLDSVQPVKTTVPDHDLKLPFKFRPLLGVWKAMFFEHGELSPIKGKSEVWNRGRYLVNGPSHCGECHTPRNLLGGFQNDKKLAGAAKGPNGDKIPSIRRDGKNGFSKWKEADIAFAMETGMKPDGDFLGGTMGEVVTNITSKLKPNDLKAIAEYLAK